MMTGRACSSTTLTVLDFKSIVTMENARTRNCGMRPPNYLRPYQSSRVHPGLSAGQPWWMDGLFVQVQGFHDSLHCIVALFGDLLTARFFGPMIHGLCSLIA